MFLRSWLTGSDCFSAEMDPSEAKDCQRSPADPQKLEESKGGDSSSRTSERANPTDNLIFLASGVACMLKKQQQKTWSSDRS